MTPYNFPRYKKVDMKHSLLMSINSFMILTYCLSDLINLIGFQFYYRPHHLMMARVIVLLACIFILGKSKILVVGGRNFFKIQFFKAFRLLFCEVVLTYYLINVSRAHLLRTEVRGDFKHPRNQIFLGCCFPSKIKNI